MDLTLLNVEHFVYKNHHVPAMPYQHNNITIQTDVMFMETFRQQILFWDGKLGMDNNLYRQHPAVVLTVVAGSEKVSTFFGLS